MKLITNTKFIKNLILAVFALVTLPVLAQEEEAEEKSPFSLSGSIDAYWRTTLHDGGDATTATGTSFANQTGFALGMANLVGSYEAGSTGVVVDLVFGPRGTQATFENDVLNGVINQAYAYWNVSEGTTLTMGRFNTWVGYEVIAPGANFNYSVSYLFSNGPFSHLGVKADFTLSDDVSLMLAITNPWDVNDTSTTGEYAFGGQLGFYDQYLNLYYDSGRNGGLGFELDYTGGFNLSDSFFLGINAAYNVNSNATVEDELTGASVDADVGFYGVALYPQLTTSDSFAIGLRGEFFQPTLDIDGSSTDDPEGVTALTLTGSFTKENLIIKPEIRLDSLKDGFTDSDGAASDGLASFLVAAIYSF